MSLVEVILLVPSRDVHESIAMISKSRESSNFLKIFSYWSRIGVSQYGLESYRFCRYCIGKYRGHIGFVDIVLVKYRGHIGFVEIFEEIFFSKFFQWTPQGWVRTPQGWNGRLKNG